jgi:hypothetical protein
MSEGCLRSGEICWTPQRVATRLEFRLFWFGIHQWFLEALARRDFQVTHRIRSPFSLSRRSSGLEQKSQTSYGWLLTLRILLPFLSRLRATANVGSGRGTSPLGRGARVHPDNAPTHSLVQAVSQLAERRAWLNCPGNVEVFYSSFEIPDDMRRDHHFRPELLLIYGRRREFEEHPELKVPSSPV